MFRIILHFLLIILAAVSAITTTTITITTTSTIIIAATTEKAAAAATAEPFAPTTVGINSAIPNPTPATPGIWSPIWLDAATYSLIIYDAIAIGLLCWLWLAGHLAWMSKDRDEVLGRDLEMMEMRRGGRSMGRGTMIEGEMRRLRLY